LNRASRRGPSPWVGAFLEPLPSLGRLFRAPRGAVLPVRVGISPFPEGEGEARRSARRHPLGGCFRGPQRCSCPRGGGRAAVAPAPCWGAPRSPFAPGWRVRFRPGVASVLIALWRSVPEGADRRWPAPGRWNRWPGPAVALALGPGGPRASARGCSLGARRPVALLGARRPVAAAGGPPSSLRGRGRLGCPRATPRGPGRSRVRLGSDEDRTVWFGHVKDRFRGRGSSR